MKNISQEKIQEYVKNILNTQILKVISQQFQEEKRYMQQ